ncbi:MAG: sulfite exporter TauE/SafE family protein [Clostridia bacterium]|nr:sulfite exporter TauE/SafE family protein [Clostridia bacterium]
MLVPTNAQKKGGAPALSYKEALIGLLGGVLNGLIGTGGGILLLLVLRKKAAPQDAFAAVLVCILPLCTLSFLLHLHAQSAHVIPSLLERGLPYLLGAVPGGLLGAYLLHRMKAQTVITIFAWLLCISGARMLL